MNEGEERRGLGRQSSASRRPVTGTKDERKCGKVQRIVIVFALGSFPAL